MTDEFYMRRAIELAKKGRGWTNPNPMVGAVIVKNGSIIGEGYHEKCGELHAERNAIASLTESAEGATLYVTLEPCCHYGKTPPCVDQIIENRIKRVVIGMVDPNPLVSGKGVKKLQEAGIDVTVGILEDKCKKLNEVFIKYITKKKPFVVLKTAMSLDGKISTTSGESKWITDKEARENVHILRNELTAIMIGIDTVIIDNPELTCRIPNGRNPIRIVVDSNLRIPYDSKILQTAKKFKTIIATTEKARKEKIHKLKDLGIIVIETKSKNEKVDLKDLMHKLGNQNIDSILLEGGSTLNYSALESGIVDKILVYIAPKIIGGMKSKTPVGGSGISHLKDAFKVRELSTSIIGKDILLQGYIEGDES